MPLIYRSMTVDGGKPLVASTGRGLGVRLGNSPNDDIAVDVDGNVHPRSGGMSVVPTWRDLKVHRIPKRLKHIVPEARGNNSDACWRFGDGGFDDGVLAPNLSLRRENETHGFVEPARVLVANEYVASLAATRDQWIIDEE